MEKKVFEFLDKLRESGETNMFGAIPYIQAEFGFGYDKSKKYLIKWMRTFAQRNLK